MKLDETSVLEILTALEKGESQVSLSKKYNVSKKTIQNIKSGKGWRTIINLRDAIKTDEAMLKNEINEIFKKCRLAGYPYLSYSTKELLNDFTCLRGTPRSKSNFVTYNKTGIKIINHFHPHIDEVKSGGKLSPVEAFYDDARLEECIRKLVKLKKLITPSSLRSSLMSLNSVQKCSNFPPVNALNVYSMFNPKKVLDFSAGWGGRLLASTVFKSDYLGIDPSDFSIQGNKKILEFLNENNHLRSNINLMQGCAEDLLPNLTEKFDLIFTSPPYFDTEHYDSSFTQSYLKFPQIEDWFTGFLRKSIKESYRLLEDSGHLVLNVDNFMITRVLLYASEEGFKILPPLILQLNNRGVNTKIKTKYREEPILVFRK